MTFSTARTHFILFTAMLAFALFNVGCGGSADTPDEIGDSDLPTNPPGTYTKTTDTVYLFPVKVDGKWGYIDSLGYMVIQPQYLDAAYFSEGLAAVELPSGSGYIDHKNTVVIPCIYDYAMDFHDGWANIFGEGGTGFINKVGSSMRTIRIDGAEDFDNGFAAVSRDGKYGVIDTSGALVIDLKYDFTSIYMNYVEADRDGGEVLVDMQGNEVIPYGYNSFIWYGDYFVEVDGDEGEGIVDIRGKGKEVIPPMYDDVTVYQELGLIGAVLDTMSYLFTLEGKQIFRPIRDWDVENGNEIIVELGGKSGLIDYKGNILVPLKYDFIGMIHEGVAYANVDDKSGMVDARGKVVVPFIYDWVSAISDGLAVCSKDGKHGYINAKGEVIIPLEFYDCSEFFNGLAYVQEEEDGLFGYIDVTGNYVIPPTLIEAYDFLESGYTYAESAEGMGLLDRTGAWVIPPKYDDLDEDVDILEWFILELDNSYGVGNVERGEVIAPVFDDVNIGSDVIELIVGSNRGLAALDGTILLEPRFYSIESPVKGMRKFTYRVRRGAKKGDYFGYLNRSGKIVWFSGDADMLKRPI
jgi:hypothetical protein